MRISKFLKLGVAVAGITALIGSNVFAEGLLEDSGISLSGDFSVNSSYLWRGFLLDKDAVIQNGLYASGYGVSASVWANNDITVASDSNASDEIDYSLEYSYSLEPISIAVGYVYYDNSDGLHDNGSTSDLYGKVSLDNSLSPYFMLVKDITHSDRDGMAVIMGAGYELPLVEDLYTFNASAEFGYLDKYGVNDTAEYLDMGVGVDIKLTDVTTLTPKVRATIPFGDLAEKGSTEDTQVYCGITFSYSL